MTGTTPTAAEPTEQLPQPTRLSDVKGWFFTADQLLFDWFLTHQREQRLSGDLLELGAYLGKSAIFLGSYLEADEAFTVCDLFDSPAPDASNTREMNRSYATLTRRAFEANYLSFHPALPTVVQAPTSAVTDHVRPASCRFVHVDASHLYEHVHGDIEAARQLLLPEGVVAFDDFRSEHCPGVAAAVWGAVATAGLKPICVTGTKFYGTWGDPTAPRDALRAWLKTRRPELWHGVEEVAGHPLIRVSNKKAVPPAHPKSRHTAAIPAQRTAAGAAGPAARTPQPSLARRLAKDLLPPVLTRAVAARRTR
ncbi:class I SAM-dependent methyltransferase [Streptomyces sp. NBC_01465]|uniref:class I SAM-dependent methyltransferase n=1 Tax=Streptomyces sp. NBC_01465 TaxID=2903878 RepID=UPI002E32B2F9|nr:class I SAM-dependent methyltransferase [Streptomyces sp. NBC_01465]